MNVQRSLFLSFCSSLSLNPGHQPCKCWGTDSSVVLRSPGRLLGFCTQIVQARRMTFSLLGCSDPFGLQISKIKFLMV